MKKILLFGCVVGLFTFSSCSKDYTCTCTSTGNVTVWSIPNASKSQAVTICKAHEQYVSGQTVQQQCDLK